ncbi:ABC transporter permease, partial [Salinispira pacifica]
MKKSASTPFRSRLSGRVMELTLLAICVLLAFIAPGFLTAGNLFNVLRNISLQGIIAFGMTMIIITGEIDLSVGSAVAFSGCLAAFLTQALGGAGVGAVLAVTLSIVTVVVVGFAIGTFTGFVRNRFAVPTFITTLALMTILSGAANLITGGFPITSFPDWYNFFGGGYVFGIPFSAIVLLIAFIIMQFVMTSTSFGRYVYATGGNAEAARLNGVNIHVVKYIVLGTTGALAALSGVMVSSQIMSGTPTVGQQWELEVISAVIIGGTSLFGGEGKIWGTFVGVAFLGIIINGMTLLNISQYWQFVVRGVLIL